MTTEEIRETIIDYVIDTYSLNKDRGVVANHVDEWLDCRQQVKSVDLADVVKRSEQLKCECTVFSKGERIANRRYLHGTPITL